VSECSRCLKLAGSFDYPTNVSETGRNAESQKNQRKPWRCIKFTVQEHPDSKTDKNSKRNGEAEAAVIGQLLECTCGFSSHEKGTLPRWKRLETKSI